MSGLKKNRNHIPIDVKRDIFREAGGRCAVPVCRESISLEMAHIIPVSEKEDDSIHNLILLCANCHTRFDGEKNKDKGYDRKQLLRLKKNLLHLNNKYCNFELRLLEYFLNTPDTIDIMLYDREIDVMYLVRDGLIKDSGKRLANSMNFPQKIYLLTDLGKSFINRWKEIQKLD